MRKKCIVISTIIVLLFEILFPGLITYAEDGSGSSGSGINISKSVNWTGTSNPEQYRATYKLYEQNQDLAIDSIEDLVKLSRDVDRQNSYEGKVIVLTRDLDFNDDNSYEDPTNTGYGDLNKNGKVQTIKEELTDNNGIGFTPIGYKYFFSGKFYGQNFEIRNLYINKKDESYHTGLFGAIKNAEIRDLIVTGEIKIDNVTDAGTIAAYIENSKIVNCNSEVDIECKSNVGSVGGIVGAVGENNSIINCVNTGKISGILKDGSSFIGGIVGAVIQPKKHEITLYLQNCHNEGDIDIESEKSTYIGGIIGRTELTEIDKCYNTANIKVKFRDGCTSMYVGGIVGVTGTNYVGWETIIKNSYNAGEIIVTGNPPAEFDIYKRGYQHIGGIIGQAEVNILTIVNCCNIGDISSTSPELIDQDRKYIWGKCYRRNNR